MNFNTLKTIFISGILTAAIPAAALASCPGESSRRSIESTTPAPLTFMNSTDNNEDYYRIYWIDFQGNRQLYTELFPGETYRVDTFLTHPWLITAPVPGGGEDCIGFVMPVAGGGVVNLE